MDPLKIYDYLTLSRQRVLHAVRSLTPQQYSHPFTFGLKTIGMTLTHMMNSEWYYIERLDGRPVPPYEQWPMKEKNPPSFERVESTWREHSQHTRASIVAERDWQRRITYLGFPDDTRGNRRFEITATASDIVTQLALHEMHHRAQVLVMLRELEHPVQDIDYNDMMYERREIT